MILSLERSPSPVDKYPWTLWQRIIMVCTAFFVSILMSGVTVGHLALREILLQTKPYLCKNMVEMHAGNQCYQRELQLNGVFFVSTLAVKFLSYPVGVALDVYGPRLTSMFGCLVFGTGCIMLACSRLDLGLWHYIGYCVMAVGGLCVYMPSLQLCRILPKLSGLMMAVLTSAFDVSAVVFVLLGKVYLWFEGRVPINQIIGWYTLVPAIGFVLVTTFYPDGEIPIARRQKPAWGAVQPYGDSTLHSLLTNSAFWLTAIFTGVMTSRFTLFLSTLNIRLAEMGLGWTFQRSVLSGLTTFFPLGGVISMTAVGQLIHSFSLATNLLILWVMVVWVWPSVMQTQSREMQALSVVLCAILRPYYYSVTNQLCERLFGQRNLGMAYGLVLAVAAIINLVPIHIVYNSWMLRSWFLVQTWRLVNLAANVGVILPIYLYYHKL